ncbi:S-adenosyl-L-methionine-dependent methyltransferase [Gigaspora rosea]|uniref:S-adenosyl-L-methionine-dependent methyltransferase n=1 Tax=Gigaspora rosea TaxID=44941 RepID=A0A397VAP5_9GLOM|nr:S-adenosyl-L-methionine-dependent methyltransferase [Gigaspora rosea]CAG8520232.1 14294_t:CDS:2 [Gigaspora rosea]
MGNSLSHKRSFKKKKDKDKNALSVNDCSDSSSVKSYHSSNDNKFTTPVEILDGRPYFSEETYLYPVDWEEADRIQLKHFMLKLTIGGNYTAPLAKIIKPGSKILDIACGAGHWSFEMAQEFQNADVYGVDILPQFPSEIKPPNCHFTECNIKNGLPFEDNEFDYVFMRYLHLVMKEDQWIPLSYEINRVLKPGGFVESVELDACPHSLGPVGNQLYKKLYQPLIELKGIDLRFAPKIESTFRSAGFENVTCVCKDIKLGKQGGKIGELWASNFKASLTSLRPVLTPIAKMTKKEWDNDIETIANKEFDLYNSYSVLYISLGTKRMT